MEGPESILHCLRNCDEVFPFWDKVVKLDHWSRFFSINLDSWLRMNLKEDGIGHDNLDWLLFFGVTIWMIWKDRNRLVSERHTDMSTVLFFQVLNYLHTIERALENESLITTLKKEVTIGWVCPNSGVFKLNTDGSVHDPNNVAACGGLIPDYTGSFMRGFTCNVGVSSAIQAKLWGLYWGLMIAKDMGIQNLSVELDSSSAIC
ncbi:hypothetical protein RIF29_20214 [Crotalaria pallida]|uniref:RNase H type-1 domain-containing protein n=1 Tax=Crotalaria pallida TaxID=3830 RepID=A0AAN9F535_CROPI